jgi:hypothetical protein
MPTLPSGTLACHDGRVTEHDVAPDLAWVAVGGGAVLAACAALLALSAGWGGQLPGAPMPADSVAAIPTYYSGLAATSMAGFLVVLVARSLGARTR